MTLYNFIADKQQTLEKDLIFYMYALKKLLNKEGFSTVTEHPSSISVEVSGIIVKTTIVIEFELTHLMVHVTVQNYSVKEAAFYDAETPEDIIDIIKALATKAYLEFSE